MHHTIEDRQPAAGGWLLTAPSAARHRAAYRARLARALDDLAMIARVLPSDEAEEHLVALVGDAADATEMALVILHAAELPRGWRDER